MRGNWYPNTILIMTLQAWSPPSLLRPARSERPATCCLTFTTCLVASSVTTPANSCTIFCFVRRPSAISCPAPSAPAPPVAWCMLFLFTTTSHRALPQSLAARFHHRGTYLRTKHRKQTDGYLGLVMWGMQHQSSWPPQSHNSMMTIPVRRLTFCAFLRKLIWYTLPQDCFCSIHLSCDCTVSCNR